MSAAEIIEEFRIPRSTLYRMVASGKITAREETQAYHLRRHWTFDGDEVREAIRKIQAEREAKARK